MLAGLGGAAVASMGAWSNAPVLLSCTDISTVPVQYTITYGAAIQGVFDNFATNGGNAGCVDCHFPPSPTGNLDLTDGVSWSHLVNIPSYEDSSVLYVVPNQPEQSLLFQKVNCDMPGVGSRMPFDGYGGGLTVEQQALIYDWIAEGAPSDMTDGIFRGTFDTRGFIVDEIFGDGFELQ